MSLLEKWGKAIDSLDETAMDECLHNDYKFTLHSAGKTLTKVDVINWVKSGDIKRDRVRILYENDEIGVCLLYTSPSPRDQRGSRMPSSA